LFEHDLFRKSLPRFGIMRGEWLDFVVFTGLPALWQLTSPPGAAGADLSIEAISQRARHCVARDWIAAAFGGLRPFWRHACKYKYVIYLSAAYLSMSYTYIQRINYLSFTYRQSAFML